MHPEHDPGIGREERTLYVIPLHNPVPGDDGPCVEHRTIQGDLDFEAIRDLARELEWFAGRVETEGQAAEFRGTIIPPTNAGRLAELAERAGDALFDLVNTMNSHGHFPGADETLHRWREGYRHE